MKIKTKIKAGSGVSGVIEPKAKQNPEQATPQNPADDLYPQ